MDNNAHRQVPAVPQIMVCYKPTSEFARQAVMGVSEYGYEHGPWDMIALRSSPMTEEIIAGYAHVSGIIAAYLDFSSTDMLVRMGVPLVQVHDLDWKGLPRVGANDLLVGRMALGNFKTKGYRRVAYCGLVGTDASVKRRDGFVDEAVRNGMDVYVYEHDVYEVMAKNPADSERFMKWVAGLPKPIGLMVYADITAGIVMHFCRELNILVPEEIAILGVDNNPLLCNLMRPRLSSIDHGAHRAGYEAASLLSNLMRGHAPPPRAILVDPVGVVERQSADATTVEHPGLLAAMTFIRSHAHEGIQVTDVLEAVPLSRRALERGFQQALGRTIHQEILRIRVEDGKRMLLNTHMTMPEISERAGFSYSSKFSEVFKRVTGLTPREFRQKHRPGYATQKPMK